MAKLPAAEPALRAQLEAEAAEHGWGALHARLRGLDPAAAARIHPNDPQRIQRALEVHALTGRSISSWQAETRGAAGAYHWLRHALWPGDRAAQAVALAERFDAMLAAGLCAEVQRLHARGDLHAALPAIRSVGYRQLWEWCEGRASLGQARERAIVATRQLCKRQMTWLRAEKDIDSWSASAPGEFQNWSKKVRSLLEHR
jgi:tRNA dimethylallyltransferase